MSLTAATRLAPGTRVLFPVTRGDTFTTASGVVVESPLLTSTRIRLDSTGGMTEVGTHTLIVVPEFRLAPSAESQPPADVLAVIAAVLDTLTAAHGTLWDGGLFVSDHNHGDVSSPGSWCIAFEGAYDWPCHFTTAQRTHRTIPASVYVESGAGWWLGVYPA